MRSLALTTVLIIGAALSCFAQGSREPETFFKRSIGLSADQITAIEQGRPVTKELPTSTPGEVVVFGAVYIHGSIENYLRAARDVTLLRESPNYLGIQMFSNPPQFSDLRGFVLEEQDIKDLKDCKPGNCDLQLPAEAIENVKTQVDWSASDVAAQVNNLAQKKALDVLLQYQREGDRALGSYYDKEQPVKVIDEFSAFLGQSSSMSNYLPGLKQYLIAYPRAQLSNAESSFYWERVKFGLKPTLRINQMVVYRGQGPSGPIDSIAIKQLYASHYFRTALDLSVCAKDSSKPDAKGFYLITVKGSRQAGLTGAKGSIVRHKAVGRVRSSLESSLLHIKQVLESSHPAAASLEVDDDANENLYQEKVTAQHILDRQGISMPKPSR